MQNEKTAAPMRRVRRVVSVTTRPDDHHDHNQAVNPVPPAMADPVGGRVGETTPHNPAQQRLAPHSQRQRPVSAQQVPSSIIDQMRAADVTSQNPQPQQDRRQQAVPQNQPPVSQPPMSQPPAGGPLPQPQYPSQEAAIAAAAASLRGAYEAKPHLPRQAPFFRPDPNAGLNPEPNPLAERTEPVFRSAAENARQGQSPFRPPESHPDRHSEAVPTPRAKDDPAVAAQARHTVSAHGHGATDLDLADQLFELTYVIAVKERAWRRFAGISAAAGVLIGWLVANLFGANFFAPQAPDMTAAISAPKSEIARSAMNGAGARRGCTVLSLDRKTGQTTAASCEASDPRQ